MTEHDFALAKSKKEKMDKAQKQLSDFRKEIKDFVGGTTFYIMRNNTRFPIPKSLEIGIIQNIEREMINDKDQAQIDFDNF